MVTEEGQKVLNNPEFRSLVIQCINDRERRHLNMVPMMNLLINYIYIRKGEKVEPARFQNVFIPELRNAFSFALDWCMKEMHITLVHHNGRFVKAF